MSQKIQTINSKRKMVLFSNKKIHKFIARPEQQTSLTRESILEKERFNPLPKYLKGCRRSSFQGFVSPHLFHCHC
jgi:hypothetical protein